MGPCEGVPELALSSGRRETPLPKKYSRGYTTYIFDVIKILPMTPIISRSIFSWFYQPGHGPVRRFSGDRDADGFGPVLRGEEGEIRAAHFAHRDAGAVERPPMFLDGLGSSRGWNILYTFQLTVSIGE